MLSKQYKLREKKDFERVFKEGKGFKEDFLFLKFLTNNLGKSRFGFVVGEKVSKKATVRNKIKRRLSEIVRLRFSKIKKGVDGILIARSGVEEKDFLEIEKTLDRLFKKANLFVK